MDVAGGPKEEEKKEKRRRRTPLESHTGQRGKESLTPDVPLPDFRAFDENPELPFFFKFFCKTIVSAIHGYS